MAFDQNSKVKDILMNEEACAIIEKYFPGFSRHPKIYMVKNFTIKQIASFPQVGISDELFKTILEDLSKIE